MTDTEERAARRALRRSRRAGRRGRRQARRADLALFLTPLIEAAEVLIVGGAEKLEWTISQFFDCIDLPGIDEDEIDTMLEGAIEEIVARLFPR